MESVLSLVRKMLAPSNSPRGYSPSLFSLSLSQSLPLILSPPSFIISYCMRIILEDL